MTAQSVIAVATGRERFLGCPIDLFTTEETVKIAENAMRRRTPTLHAVVNVAKLVNMRRDVRVAFARNRVDAMDLPFRRELVMRHPENLEALNRYMACFHLDAVGDASKRIGPAHPRLR